MARGNQRERDREKKTKKDSKVVSITIILQDQVTVRSTDSEQQRTANTLSGTAFQHAKENNADIMREKQRKGTVLSHHRGNEESLQVHQYFFVHVQSTRTIRCIGSFLHLPFATDC